MPLLEGLSEQLSYSEIVEQLRNGGTGGRTPVRGEDIFAGTDYPRTWAGFIGQEQAKEQLMARSGRPGPVVHAWSTHF